ncbi:hypothetical protein TPHA_0E01920 [Tetrapisispora phaffii CBS 4417]|uniref:Peptidase A1 domain-containing protein n=1 Tax=Tetrapisispora phaffii (strain ATCC 24235 / CBS 4417 / NBRC 1672 / NRRL Y-8282 / UCD 70-5) TaxID=1071381 RepID=G8BTQ6_TETPH|nr:hypothetical protein TPHA_0E01920 [Tetrapisispora phaffii CBS 4417]CCE63284.1 hypothetical protein TPHA_0E01920 [Tetrapisispora phaffii CBS 4417]
MVSRSLLLTFASVITIVHPSYAATTTKSIATSAEAVNSFPTLAVGKDSKALYYVNISIGIPSQEENVRVDIAQPYIWLPAKNSTCETSSCVVTSSFNNQTSNSSVLLQDGQIFSLDFIDSISLNGTFYKDDLTCSNLVQPLKLNESLKSPDGLYTTNTTDDSITLVALSFINAIDYQGLTIGSLGLASSTTSDLSGASLDFVDDSFSFLTYLSNSEVIDTPSYSLWLGGDTLPYTNMTSINSTTIDYCGNLVLGAVDQRYYEGRLVQFDMLPALLNNVTEAVTYGLPIIPMGPIYIENSSGTQLNLTTTNFLEPVLLDSRYTNARLPLNTVIQIATQLNAAYVEEFGSWIVECSLAEMNVNLNFNFQGLTIPVSLNDFLSRVINSTTGEPIKFSESSEDACALAVYPNTDIGFNILGGPFLKNIYLAIDNEGRSVAIAKAVKEDDTSAINSISSNSSDNETHISTSVKKTTSHSGNSTVTTSTKSETFGSIQSGTIPFATSYNITATSRLTLIRDVHDELSTYPIEFTAILTSNGLVSSMRSYFTTDRITSSTVKTSQSQFVSIPVRSGLNGTATTYTASAIANKIAVLNKNMNSNTNSNIFKNPLNLTFLTCFITLIVISWAF